MPSIIPYSLAFVGIFLTTSLAVLGLDDSVCFTKGTCEACVQTKTNITEVGNNGTCIYETTREGPKCVDRVVISEDTINTVYKVEGCASLPTPAPSNTTTTTPAPTTTNATTPTTTVPTTTTPSSNSTTTTPASTTTTPASNSTTTTVPTTTPPSNGTTTTPAPTNVTTTTLPPTPAPTPTPRKGGFAWGEFIGGIVFAVALSSVAYLIWRFYKARLDRNYHTLSTNLI